MDLSEPVVRFAVFGGVLSVLAVAEAVWPRRVRMRPRFNRWMTNLAMVGLSSIILRVLAILPVPLIAVFAAQIAESRGIGLMHTTEMPGAWAVVIAVLVLDVSIWAQHIAFHRIPALWRLHRVHHADRDLDATTGVRFHPIEMVLSAVYKSAIVLVIGAPVAGVVLFEIILNATAMFNHANLKLPRPIDWVVRSVLVTPDMHRVHHSIEPEEHNRNFGFALSVWDRVFGTYLPEPAKGQEGVVIGLRPWLDTRPEQLSWSLLCPLEATRLRVPDPVRADDASHNASQAP